MSDDTTLEETAEQPPEPEDYRHIVVLVRGGCVQGARLEDGTPIWITVHDYDLTDEDIASPDVESLEDAAGDHYEALIA